MRSILRKLAVCGAVVISLALVGPGNLALAAKGGGGAGAGKSAAVQKCINANARARQAAIAVLKADITKARNLPAAQQQAAVKAAIDKFTAAGQHAKTVFDACIAAARG